MSRNLSQAKLADCVRGRRGEIEQAALARAYAISDPASVKDPEYVAGLREAVESGLTYALAAVEAPGTRARSPAPIPPQLLAQARYAARSGVSLDTVLRRYFAGYTLLGDFIVQAAEETAAPASDLQSALREGGSLFDRLVASVSQEYAREIDGGSHTTWQRRTAQVRMLLGGEPLDTIDLGYDLKGWHLGVIATGPGVRAALREIAAALGRRLLAVSPEDGILWAWLGGRERLPARDALRVAESCWSGQGVLALGEPGQGVEGWRHTHRQAKAALGVARRGAQRHVTYADVALLASALNDEILADSLHEIYLAPLSAERDDGVALRATLTAYFDSGRNISSTAAALRVSRNTVSMRLRSVEEKIGRSMDSCAAELQTALRLGELKARHD